MIEFPYSRLLNRPVRYLKFFSIGDLFIVVIGLLIITPLFGFATAVIIFGVYFVHLLVFRMGKRPGYDTHYFKSLLRPDCYRVGGVGRRPRMVNRSASDVSL